MKKTESWGIRLIPIGFAFLMVGAIMYEMIDSGITFQYIIETIQQDWNLGVGFMLTGFFITVTGLMLTIVALHKE